MQQGAPLKPRPGLGGEEWWGDRPSITGQEIAELIRQGKACNLDNYQVSGDVDLTAVKFEKPFVIRNTLFTGTVNLKQGRFERGADFKGCRFQECLILSDARVEGPLILDDVVIGETNAQVPNIPMIQRIIASLKEGRRRVRSDKGDTRDQKLKKIRRQLRRRASRHRWEDQYRKATAGKSVPAIVADLTNLRVAGCLSLMNAQVFGGMSCTHADIEDDFRIDEVHIHGDLKLRRANLGEFCSDGRRRLPHGSGTERPEQPSRIDGELDLTSATIGGDIRLLGVSIGSELTLQTAEIKGNFLCRPSEHAHANRLIRVRARLKDGAWLLGARIGGSIDFGGTRIYGGLSLNTARVGGRLECSRSGRWALTIHGSIDMTSSTVGATANFTGCRIRGDVNLTGTRVGSDLSFTGACLGGDLLLQNASIGGYLFCTATESRKRNVPCRIAQEAWLLGAAIAGDADFSGASIGNLIMQNAKVGHNLNAKMRGGFRTHIEKSLTLDNASVGANISLTGAWLGGDLTLQNASAGGTFFCTATSGLKPDLPCEISAKVWLLGAVIAGGLEISGTRIGGSLVMQNIRIGQDFQAKIMGGFPTEITGDVLLNGARISGVAEIAGAALQRKLILNNALIESGLQVMFGFNDVAPWEIVRARVGSGIYADSATIGKRVMLMGLDVGESSGTDPDAAPETHDVDFSGAQVNGVFLLYSPEAPVESLETHNSGFDASEIPPQREKELIAQALQERTVIKGNLLLTRAEVLGGIVLDGSTIEGELEMQDANVRANITCRPIETAPERIDRASVRRADFETLNLTGDLDLTGLTIGGDLILRDSRIRGRLELYPLRGLRRELNQQAGNGKPTPEERIAGIGGALRLDAAEVSHIIVSGRSFGPRPDSERSLWERIKDDVKTAWRRGDYFLAMLCLRGGNPEGDLSLAKSSADIVLERATVGRLEIAEPLPGTVDLSNLTVGSWEEHDRANFFRNMLRRSYPFKRSSYLAIENDLRNKGRDEEADKVHVWMRQRDRVNTGNFGRVLWDRLLDLSTKYGTTSVRLFWLMLILFAISVELFRDPNHVEYNIPPSPERNPPISHIPPNPWSIGDAVFLAVRLHVPIVSLGIEEEVQPSRTWLKAYAVAAVAASWVMWPLFIASLSGFLRKRS